MIAKGIVEVCQNVPFDILVANLKNITLRAPKHMAHCSSSDSIINIIDPKQVDKERLHTITTVKAISEPPAHLGRRLLSTHQQRLGKYYLYASRLHRLSYQIHYHARTISRNAGCLSWKNQYITPPIKSIYPRQKQDQFMLYRVSSVWKRERLKRRKLIKCWWWKSLSPPKWSGLCQSFFPNKHVTLLLCVDYQNIKVNTLLWFVSSTTDGSIHWFCGICEDILHIGRK